MWNQRNVLRHNYLQSTVQLLNPSIINDAVSFAMQNSNTIWPSPKDFPKHFKVFPLAPQGFGMHVEKNKLRLSYGTQGLPNIIRSLGFYSTVGAALKTLIDLLYNPYECCRAINDFYIVKRLEDVIFKILPETRKNINVINSILKCYELISVRQVGAIKMMKQFNLIDTFYDMILCECFSSCRCGKILSNLSSFSLVAEEMIEYNHLGKLKKIFDKVVCTKGLGHLYNHLCNLLSLNPAKGVKKGYFEFLLPKICETTSHQAIIIKCIAQLVNCTDGQKSFDHYDGIRILYKILSSDETNPEILEYAALAFQNATISKKSMWKCRELWDLPLILLRRSYDKNNINLQNYSIRALQHITSMPSVKNFVRRTCKQKILQIPCRSEDTRKLKDNLMHWIRKKPYMNVQIDDVEDCENDIQES